MLKITKLKTLKIISGPVITTTIQGIGIRSKGESPISITPPNTFYHQHHHFNSPSLLDLESRTHPPNKTLQWSFFSIHTIRKQLFNTSIFYCQYYYSFQYFQTPFAFKNAQTSCPSYTSYIYLWTWYTRLSIHI